MNLDSALRLGFQCHACGAIDFCFVDYTHKHALCGACVPRDQVRQNLPPPGGSPGQHPPITV